MPVILSPEALVRLVQALMSAKHGVDTAGEIDRALTIVLQASAGSPSVPVTPVSTMNTSISPITPVTTASQQLSSLIFDTSPTAPAPAPASNLGSSTSSSTTFGPPIGAPMIINTQQIPPHIQLGLNQMGPYQELRVLPITAIDNNRGRHQIPGVEGHAWAEITSVSPSRRISIALISVPFPLRTSLNEDDDIVEVSWTGPTAPVRGNFMFGQFRLVAGKRGGDYPIQYYLEAGTSALVMDRTLFSTIAPGIAGGADFLDKRSQYIGRSTTGNGGDARTGSNNYSVYPGNTPYTFV